MTLAYASIRGTRIHGDNSKAQEKPCVRCGIMRKASGGGGKRYLCRDCSSSMPKDMADLWRTP